MRDYFKESVVEKEGTLRTLCPFKYEGKTLFGVTVAKVLPVGFVACMPDDSYEIFYYDKIQNVS